MQGILTYWSKERGFGFIQTAQRESFFLHITAITEGPLIPTVGCLVEFEPGAALPGKKAPNAVNAKITLPSAGGAR
jgi:cold shock CspA family protein